jgi:hypothetical protein
MAEQELIVLLRIVPSHSALRSHDSAGARARSKHQQQSTVIAKNSTLIISAIDARD